VHAMNADYPFRGFPRRRVNARIDPSFSTDLKMTMLKPNLGKIDKDQSINDTQPKGYFSFLIK